MDRSEAMYECEVDTDGWADLRERLTVAALRVDELANRAAALHHTSAFARLDGKRDGLRVALSYMNEWDRSHSGSAGPATRADNPIADWRAGPVAPCGGGSDHAVCGFHAIVRCVCGAAFMSTDAGIAFGMASGPAAHISGDPS